MKRPRILLADDHVLITDAYKKLLEPEFQVIGTTTDGKNLISAAMQLSPDLIIVDLGLPIMSGVDAGRHLKALCPATRLLVVTMNEDVAVAEKVLREWASGFLLKKCAATELIFAIRTLLEGKSYVTPRITFRLERNRIPELQDQGAAKVLSRRQKEVLRLLAEGLTMKEAAVALSLTVRTVAFHKYSIMQGFDLHSNLDLLRLAIREQLVSSM
jgi:DNA-binding NarL/FixJ family response regulator